jgi:hypothetical protein
MLCSNHYEIVLIVLQYHLLVSPQTLCQNSPKSVYTGIVPSEEERSHQKVLASIISDIGSPAPSTFGNSLPNYFGKLKEKGHPVNFQIHRDTQLVFSFPTSLALPEIGMYIDEINSVDLDKLDYDIAEELCLLMMEVFLCEDDRKVVANGILQKYFDGTLNPFSFFSVKGTNILTDCTILHKLPSSKQIVMILNGEDKLELGEGNASAVEECNWYHLQYLSKTTWNQLVTYFCCPAILLSLVGPYLSFSIGLQIGGRYVADPVAPFLQLFILPYQQEKMMEVAKALRATKNTISRLTQVYNRYDNWIHTNNDCIQHVQLEYSYPRHFILKKNNNNNSLVMQ